ncbi:molybdate ABC transporter substrate-binding protein [Endozoicomonas sp. OPT23]|uniref:molybdate ABC transporter substrate-binding protein n=1 Tax=Endozoicomonas sp. OPT23 TaxID=2072845 RepID=UPI001890CE1C|nr:molybdate ABC transporter substrate-binding protein [Endozoicomonas sp. OPT23]
MKSEVRVALSFTAFLASVLLSFSLQAQTLRVAVSANFKPVLESLAERFEKQLEEQQEKQHQKKADKILLSTGSTGTLYNQIINGAPYDLFLSADSARPMKLEQKDRIVAGSRKTYAYGRLVLWDRRASDQKAPITLEQLSGWKERLAIANPGTAPYGVAAQQTLEHLNLWNKLQGKLVMGNSVQQTWQFVASGNVSIGMVALSQLKQSQLKDSQLKDSQLKQATLIPDSFYQPIKQEMVVLKESQLATQFADFILSESSQQFITEHGYYSFSGRHAIARDAAP